MFKKIKMLNPFGEYLFMDDNQRLHANQIRKSQKTERGFCRQNRFADFIVIVDCVWLVGIYEAIISRVRCVSKGKAR